MKKIIYIIIFACTFVVNAQEFKLSPYTQYLAENTFAISPTFAGIDQDFNRIRVGAVFQWVGLKNAPSTQNASYDFRFAEKSGGGIMLYNDKNGATKQMGGQLSYAHHLILNDGNEEYLSLGISYKFNSFRIDTDGFDDGSGEGFDDPAVGAALSTTNHNFEFGALYRYMDFFITLNANNILNKKVEGVFNGNEPKKLRNYYLYTGYTFLSRNGEYEYEPSIYVKYFEGDGRSVSDLNFKARKITDTGYIWAGLNSRFINDQGFNPLSLSPMIGIKKDQFYVGYGFQWNINEATELNNGGTHMLTLGFDLENTYNN